MLAIADVAVTVKDAKAAAEWWQDKVGFGVHTIGQPGSHAIMVAPPGERFLLHLCEGFDSVEPGNTGIAFMTDNIEQQVRRMESSGVRFSEPLKQESWGGSAKFEDLDGNVFWLLGAPANFIREEMNRRAGRRTSKPRPKRRRSAEARAR